MKSKLVSVALMLCVLLTTSLAFAQVPELRGTWKGDALVQTPDKAWTGKCAYIIDNQDGHSFTGYKLWFGKDQILLKEKFAGIFDGKELLFAEMGDGIAEGFLTGKQSMTIRYVEHGATAKAILYKLERVSFTTGFVEIDKDGDKMIMSAEIVNHYPLNAERIIKEADTNNDGKLTLKEWEAWTKRQQ